MTRSMNTSTAGGPSTGRDGGESSGGHGPSRARVPRYRKELGPESIRSTITESRLASLWKYYKIPHDLLAFIPHSSERINKPPPGSIAMYEEQLKVGLHFPLHHFPLHSFFV